MLNVVVSILRRILALLANGSMQLAEISKDVKAIKLTQQEILSNQAEGLKLLQDIKVSLEVPLADHFDVTVTIEGQPPQQGVVSVIIKANQKFTISVQALTSKDQPAPVENVNVSSSNPAVLAVSDDPSNPTDPATGLITGVAKGTGLAGSAQLSITADADLGEGEKLLVAILDVQVDAEEATHLVINTGPVEDQ